MGQEQRINNPMPHETRPAPPAVAALSATTTAAGTTKDGTPKHGTAKGGAPAANSNRLATGVHSSPGVQAIRLNLGTLPESMKRVELGVYQFRRLLENAVADAKGEISLIDAALIQTACRHERASQLALRWLREHEKELSHGERLAYNKAIADSSAARDKTLERLKLDTAADPVADFYRQAEAARQAAESSRAATPTPATVAPAAATRDAAGQPGPEVAHKPANASGAIVGDLARGADSVVTSGELRVPLSLG